MFIPIKSGNKYKQIFIQYTVYKLSYDLVPEPCGREQQDREEPSLSSESFTVCRQHNVLRFSPDW